MQQSFAGYDVISIKPNASGSGSMRISSRETTFQATNTSLKMMLLNAYGVRDALITGLPKWAESDRWDINAKIVDLPKKDAEDKLTREQSTEAYRSKVRSILTDRFKLKVHKEVKTLPTYDLTILPGPLLFQKSTPGEEDHSGTNVHNRSLTATAIALKDFARFLSDQTDRTVIDKTGLEGLYDLTLKWSADELAEATKETGTADRPPDIFSALQEQLGLKLVPGKGPSEVLVVDSIEQPMLD
ncbi:MAG: TIGR03435 family protein [Janthinobacterium lividum]